jgi:integrase
VSEGDFDFDQNLLWIDGKTGQKEIPMLPEDMKTVQSMLSGDLNAPFFRHDTGRFQGQKMSICVIRRAWYKAAGEEGIEGVDLYRGTRHSSARALVGSYSLEEIKKGTMHSTTECFDRYVNFGGDAVREMYRVARGNVASSVARVSQERHGDTKVIPLFGYHRSPK